MRAHTIFNLLFLWVSIVFLYSCDPEEPIVTPPHDCSYYNTVSAINEDTTYTVECVSINPVNNYPDGYVIRSISFDPNNSNRLAILLSIGNHEPEVDDYELGIYDLCSNTYQSIVSDITPTDNFIQWSRSGRILYKDKSKHHTVRLDGTGDIELALTSIYGAVLLNDGRLMFMKGPLVIADSLGNPVDTLVNPPAGGTPTTVLPDDRIVLTSSSSISLWNPQTGLVQPVDLTPNTYYSHAVYVESAEALFWVTYNQIAFPGSQEMVGFTDIATQARVFEIPNMGKYSYMGATASADGRIAVVRVDRQYLGGCNWNIWPRIYLINPDGTDERRLVLPF